MEQPDFGKKLIEIRKANGLTQDELAEKCKITVRSIQRIEAGLVKPRAFTIKVISDILEFDFFEASKSTDNGAGNVNQDSKLEFVKTILWHIKDLFNLKTNTMRKVSILSVMFCAICFGLFILINDGKAQNSKKLDYSKFMKTNSRGIIYLFPKGELLMISNAKDTADYKIRGGIIQEYKNHIYLNGSFIGQALKSDTIIYNEGKVTIKPSYWIFKSSYGQNINYLIPKGTPIDNVVVHIDTEYMYIGKHQIKEYKYKIFLDDVFQGQVESGDSVMFKNGLIEIMK
jgi:transcriptional regulator with XRE-family HTH domain